MKLEEEDKFIKELIIKSVTVMPFEDFEDNLMLKIHKETRVSHTFMKDVKLSWFFFIVGTIFGIFLSLVVGEMHNTILGFPIQRLALVLQTIFVIFLLLQIDKLVEITKNIIQLNTPDKLTTLRRLQ